MKFNLKFVAGIFLFSIIQGCTSTRIYNLDNHRIPSDDGSTPSITKKWEDFDYMLLNVYLKDELSEQDYISNRNLIILRARNSNHERFRFLFKNYWGVEILAEEMDK